MALIPDLIVADTSDKFKKTDAAGFKGKKSSKKLLIIFVSRPKKASKNGDKYRETFYYLSLSGTKQGQVVTKSVFVDEKPQNGQRKIGQRTVKVTDSREDVKALLSKVAGKGITQAPPPPTAKTNSKEKPSLKKPKNSTKPSLEKAMEMHKLLMNKKPGKKAKPGALSIKKPPVMNEHHVSLKGAHENRDLCLSAIKKFKDIVLDKDADSQELNEFHSETLAEYVSDLVDSGVLGETHPLTSILDTSKVDFKRMYSETENLVGRLQDAIGASPHQGQP